MERSFVAENRQSRERLRSLVARLTDEGLQAVLPNGWRVHEALGHLAFWDQRALVLVRRWMSDGIGPSPIDIEATNLALLPILRALPPRAAAVLAVEAAQAIDAELEHAPADLISAIEGLGGKFRLRRSEHRCEHLAEIEALLALGSDGV